MIANAPIETSLLIFEAGFSFKSFLGTNQLGETVCSGGTNPLSYLLEHERWDHIEAFRPYGLMCLLDAYEFLGLSPLAEMARDGHLKQARWLISQGADVNAHCQGMIGDTALDSAVHEKHLDMVKLLLSAGANPNIPTWMWITATDRVSKYGPMRKKPRHDPDKYADLIEIKRLVLDAARRFPPPTYPNGTIPEVWPPEPKKK
ncbi:MAG: ankyrin repeat domain-containing protein [Phycisphaerales bacterium]